LALWVSRVTRWDGTEMARLADRLEKSLRAEADARAGRARVVSLAWVRNEQRETERAFKMGYEYKVALGDTTAELARLQHLKSLPFARSIYVNPWGGGQAPRKVRLRAGPKRACLWMYWPNGDTSTEPKGPVTLSKLVALIRSRKRPDEISEETFVVPASGGFSGLWAHRWRAIAERLPLDVRVLCKAWMLNSSARRSKRHFWAWEKAHRLIESSPTIGWKIVCGLVSTARSKAVLGHVGAGPLEDFVQMYPKWHPRVVERARRDRKFRAALGCVRRCHLTRSMMETAGRGVP
jgi:uncharacterized protein DUF6869